MIVLAALLGVAAGVALARLVDLQVRPDARSPRWLLAAVALLAAVSCVVLWQRWGWTPRFWLLAGAALVLIDTAAVDWQLKLIDTLLLAVATLLAAGCAPWVAGGSSAYVNAVAGLVVAGGVLALAWLAARLYYRGYEEPFGLGDVFLGAFIGALFGIQQLVGPLVLGVAAAGLAALALVVAHGYRKARAMPLPYGTFLCLGSLAFLLTLHA